MEILTVIFNLECCILSLNQPLLMPGNVKKKKASIVFVDGTAAEIGDVPALLLC